MRQKIYVLISVLLCLTVLSYVWWKQATTPINPVNKTQLIFGIQKGETSRSVAERLKTQGLIRSAVAFFLLARFGGVGDSIQAGNFRLNPSMDLYEITETLTHGTVDVWITIPEGWRNEEIALKTTQEFGIPEAEFLKKANEGYMFPDTYLIPKDATAETIVGIFLANFNKKVLGSVAEKAKQRGLNLSELITIASLVEREAKLSDDRPLVAGVIVNRLKLGMKLDVDATIQYVLGYQPEEKTWWKKKLTREDLEVDSSYNTYKHSGLPPSPIANPGLAAIMAVVEAPKTNYLYYISDKSGKIHFAETVEEHNKNITKYLNK